MSVYAIKKSRSKSQLLQFYRTVVHLLCTFLGETDTFSIKKLIKLNKINHLILIEHIERNED